MNNKSKPLKEAEAEMPRTVLTDGQYPFQGFSVSGD
jgi:hypothetical protein